ncbi:MAG: beta-lactamase family protein [Chrysiogenetes bacterium]|nr:beta-lactamase family protein [Chrysiogenetes bacterium]
MLDGFVHPDFYPVARALRWQVQRLPGGCAATVYYKGKCVVDIWGGAKDSAGNPWQRDTIATSFSTTKGVASTALHMCVDRGLLDYDDPVTRYWPEYGQNGKERTTIAHCLTHAAGLYNVRALVSHAEDLKDWDLVTKAMEKAAPEHAPGEHHAYHALTYGHLIGELVRRVTGAPLSEFVQKEIAEPLGLDGLYLAVPESEVPRAAQLLWKKPNRQQVGQSRKALKSPRGLLKPLLRRIGVSPKRIAEALLPVGMSEFDLSAPDVLMASIPAANGNFTARSLAKLYACLANGGEFEGVRLLSRKTLERATVIQTTRADRVIAIPMYWRLGYHAVNTTRGAVKTGFGHYGFGGSGGFADPARDLGVGMTLNGWLENPIGNLRLPHIAGVTMGCIQKIEKR